MIDILHAILPIFLTMGIGFFAERLGFLPASAAPALNAYAIRLAWPVMTVYILANAAPADLFQGRLWLGFLAGHFFIYAVSYFADKGLMRRGRGPAVITAVSASSSMSAFVSLPIIFNLLPGNKEALVTAALLAISPSFTMAAALVQLDLQRRSEGAASSDKGNGSGKDDKSNKGGTSALLRLILLNPLILGLIVGAVLCLCGIRLWAPLNSAAALVSASAAPCALISIGLSFRGQVLLASQHINRRTLGYQAALTTAKLLLLPLCTWAFLALLGVSGVPLFSAVMLTSSGVAAGAFVIADAYNYNSQDSAVALVVSNHGALSPLAAHFKVPFHHIPVSKENREEAEKRQRDLLRENNIDLVVLARYMQILSPGFIREWEGRIINIHHSFLPAFVGARPYHQAKARGVKIIGATAHYVTADLDQGPIIAQDVTRVSHRDEVEDLVRKGRDIERQVLAAAVRLHLEHRVIPTPTQTIVFA